MESMVSIETASKKTFSDSQSVLKSEASKNRSEASSRGRKQGRKHARPLTGERHHLQ